MAELAAVCDVDRERLDKAAATYNVAVYESLEDMLRKERGNIDVVSICTPNGLHADQTILALDHGYHVLCEKPMALSSADCERMIDASERNNRHLFVVKQNRFNPPVQALRKLLKEEKLGRILSVQLNCYWSRPDEYYRSSKWKGTLKMDGGTLFTQYSHFIDLLCWLFGPITRSAGYRANRMLRKEIEFEDCGYAGIVFESGVIGSINYSINCTTRNMEGSILVVGEKGTVKIGGQYLNKLDYQDIKGYVVEPIEESRGSNNYGFYQGSMSNHDKVYRNVIGVLQGTEEVATNGAEAMKSIQAIELIYQASVWCETEIRNPL
jgi:predicted dehydrogenase